jgi:hypothetical protein
MDYKKNHSRQMKVGTLETVIGFSLAVIAGELTHFGMGPEINSSAVQYYGGCFSLVGAGALFFDSLRRFDSVVRSLYKEKESCQKDYSGKEQK